MKNVNYRIPQSTTLIVTIILTCICGYGQNVNLSREQLFESSFKSIPLSKWTPGMKFVFQAGRSKDFYPHKKTKKKVGDIDGKVAIFKNVKPGFTNICQFEIEGETWFSNTYQEPVDGVAYFEYLKEIRDSLVGKDMYLLSHYWDKKGHDSRSDVKKYFKITIDSINISESSFVPYKVFFTSADGVKGTINVQIGNFNILPSDDFKFSAVFSYSNPRLKYPSIANEVWHLIQASEVAPGMTKLECRLAFGDPKKVNKTITENEVSEQWVYEGNYLYFTGDKLKVIQSN